MSKKSKAKKWFEADIPPHESAKPKRKSAPRQRIPASYIKRILDMTPKIREPYPQRNLFAGNIIELEDAKLMYAALVEFWLPAEQTQTYTHEFYLGIGSFVGDMYARRLNDAGVTHRESQDEHIEQSVYDEEHGISGRIDVIMDENIVKALGPKTPKKLPDPSVEPAYFINEFKTTGERNYAYWVEPQDLPIKYRNQFSIYAHLAFEKGITKHKEGMFTIMSRDNPNNLKNIWLACEDNLVERSFAVADKFWDYVQNKTFPSIKDVNKDIHNKEWIFDQIENQPDRKWPKLAEIEVD